MPEIYAISKDVNNIIFESTFFSGITNINSNPLDLFPKKETIVFWNHHLAQEFSDHALI